MKPPFELPDIALSSLPTGSVKTVVENLGTKIANDEFPDGAPIPMESELIEMFGVSRTVIREAIKVLSGKGMVRTARRYGTRVCAPDQWNLLDPDVIRWHGPTSPMSAKIYQHSTQLRGFIEPEAAALAAQNATPEQRERILLASQSIKTEPHGEQAMIAADFAFHAAILEASGNIMLAQMQRLILAMLNFAHITGALMVPDMLISQQSHERVAEAIVAGDADGARAAMSDMLGLNQRIADALVLRRAQQAEAAQKALD